MDIGGGLGFMDIGGGDGGVLIGGGDHGVLITGALLATGSAARWWWRR